MNKYDLDYIEDIFYNKPIYIFINHKTSVLCWAQLKNIFGIHNVLTLDSHRDFHGGLIVNTWGKIPEGWLSKYCDNKNLDHFSKCVEFLEWNLLDLDQNKMIVEKEGKFLTIHNDNFIDVAFMKNIVKDVFWYYDNTLNEKINGKCDDFLGKTHKYIVNEMNKFRVPKKKFIFDLDLDFFVKDFDNKRNLIDIAKRESYLKTIRNLVKKKNCIGITIAIEPDCCGGVKNCLKIFKELNDFVFIPEKLDFLEKAQKKFFRL